MLPHSYGDLFSYLIARGHLASNLTIYHILHIASPLAIVRYFCQILPFFPKSPISPKLPLAKEVILPSNLNRQPSGKILPLSPESPFSPKSPLSKGPGDFSLQFESPALWRFFASFAFQICHFRQKRHPPRGHFWYPIFVIFASACISGHKCEFLDNACMKIQNMGLKLPEWTK